RPLGTTLRVCVFALPLLRSHHHNYHQGFSAMTIKLTTLDLNYILTQIEMAEAGQLPVNPILSFGLREVAGTNNNLAPGQSNFGSSDVSFPTLTDPIFQNAQGGTSYAQTSGL